MISTLLKRLRGLADQDLFELGEAIDIELKRRGDLSDDVQDSARRRALERVQSYRRRTGAYAPPVRAVGLGKPTKPRRAA
jgi:hypothetical protein